MSTPAPGDPLETRAVELAARATGRRVVAIEPVPPGLGARRFLRLRLSGALPGPTTLIARIEPPPSPPAPGAPPAEPPLEPIRALLEASGLPVPGRIAGDAASRLELLEDVGDESLEGAVAKADPDRRRALYEQATLLVPRLQAIEDRGAGVAAFSRRLDGELIASKAHKWLEWTLPFALGRAATAGEREATERAFAAVARAALEAPARLAHRDFKAANLHVVADPGAPTGVRLVMIDVQGAFLAPPEYDLVCLLRDSHVPLPEDEVGVHLERIRPLLPDAPDEADFLHRFDLLTVARVAKDISHYVRAATARGDERYLRFVATGLRNLRAAAERAAGLDRSLRAFADSLDVLADDFAVRRGPDTPGGRACGR